MEQVPLASRIIDHSNSLGFQFEFICFRCGTGYRSRFMATASLGADAGGIVAKKAAGFIPIVGDFLGDKAADVLKDSAHDAAQKQAIVEVAPQFAPCPRCGRWVCRAHCWNVNASLCIDCAPLVPRPSVSYPVTDQPVNPTGPSVYGAPLTHYTGAPIYGGGPYHAPMQATPNSVPTTMSSTWGPPVAGYPPGNIPGPGSAPQYPVGPRRLSPLAVWSMILGVGNLALIVPTVFLFFRTGTLVTCGLVFLLALFAIIFGHVALGQIRRGLGAWRGSGFAATGLATGYSSVSMMTLILLLGIFVLRSSPLLYNGGLSLHFPTSTPLTDGYTPISYATSTPVVSGGGVTPVAAATAIPTRVVGGGSTVTPVATATPVPTPLGNSYYAAVWRTSNSASAFWGNLTASDLQTKAQTLHSQGLRLMSLSGAVIDGQVRFSGAWRAGNDAEQYWVNMTASDLDAKFQTLGNQGLRLVSISGYVVNGTVLFAGAWRTGTDASSIAYNLSASDLDSRFQTQGGQGQRLVSISGYVVGGQVLFAGAWRAGTDASHIAYNMTQNDLHNNAQTFGNQGERLQSLTAYISDGQVYFAAVWRTSTDADTYWVNLSGTDLEAKDNSLVNQGQRMICVVEY